MKPRSRESISEVLLMEDGEIKLLRVLLRFGLRNPGIGVWSYFINSDDGVYILDTGPLYNGTLPMLKLRKRRKKTDNLAIILSSMEKHFPGKTIKEILLSHYHFDHSENAPLLQEKIKEKFGNTPPIRLHRDDFGERKFMRLYRDSLSRLYGFYGYDTYKLGQFLEDGEELGNTGFIVKHMPGHTKGTIGLIHPGYKLCICGAWIRRFKNPVIGLGMRLINESNRAVKSSRKHFDFSDYNYLYLHPLSKKKVNA